MDYSIFMTSDTYQILWTIFQNRCKPCPSISHAFRCFPIILHRFSAHFCILFYFLDLTRLQWTPYTFRIVLETYPIHSNNCIQTCLFNPFQSTYLIYKWIKYSAHKRPIWLVSGLNIKWTMGPPDQSDNWILNTNPPMQSIGGLNIEWTMGPPDQSDNWILITNPPMHSIGGLNIEWTMGPAD